MPSEPAALTAWIGSLGLKPERIGLEAGPLSQVGCDLHARGTRHLGFASGRRFCASANVTQNRQLRACRA
ncbi:hypothetical protein FS320_37320 [Microvirga tunisiensis]|uniref:Uncharacterized protein n=1 Tax=Microvirga tunisiensis TaxID=2108360 RepID=A0A5N7MU63_9HYPH|nr:hypothetical protein [Microvirga tunisiensis]MPR30523.1 hypothetical protein [Microvirga tunisiensis]